MESLVSRVQKVRHVTLTGGDAESTLTRAQRLLQGHETPSGTGWTHNVFDNYADWWLRSSKISTFRFAISSDSTTDSLYECVETLHDMGVPLTLVERLSPHHRFFVHIDIWATEQDPALQPVSLTDPEGVFMSIIGSVLREVFPQEDMLDVVVLNASGLSVAKGVYKTSMRLVWPSVIVDVDRASAIRACLVHAFQHHKDPEVQQFGKRMLECYGDNDWASVFSSEGFNKYRNVRMPFNDRVSPAPLKRPEGRPLIPMGVVRYQHKDSDEQAAGTSKWIAVKDDLTTFEWLCIGCIRKENGAPLTPWCPPKKISAVANGTTPSKVRIKTRGGSTGSGGSARSKPRGKQHFESSGTRTNTSGNGAKMTEGNRYFEPPCRSAGMLDSSPPTTTMQNNMEYRRCVVTHNFEPEGLGELRSTTGDSLVITNDPDMANDNPNRWVHCFNETTRCSGWFPLSHTEAAYQ